MSWWPFGKCSREESAKEAQAQQIRESVERVTSESHRRVDHAKAQIEEATASALKAVDRRLEQSNFLRDALKTLIDRQTHGRYDMSRRES